MSVCVTVYLTSRVWQRVDHIDMIEYEEYFPEKMCLSIRLPLRASCHIVLCCGLCHIMLCHVMLCHVMLCHVM